MTAGIVIDTSVIVALVEGEPEAGRFEIAIQAATRRVMAAPSVLEAMIVLTRMRGADSERVVTAELAAHDIDVIPFDLTLVSHAFVAYSTYGKGRHPAGLNFGDCFAYALALQRGDPLLFKGDDFRRTDLAVAAW